MKDFISKETNNSVYETTDFNSSELKRDALKKCAEQNWGRVVKCERLNVRENPSKESLAVHKLQKGSTVAINFEDSTDNFYKIYTEVGIEGFCIKEFIEIN